MLGALDHLGGWPAPVVLYAVLFSVYNININQRRLKSKGIEAETIYAGKNIYDSIILVCNDLKEREFSCGSVRFACVRAAFT